MAARSIPTRIRLVSSLRAPSAHAVWAWLTLVVRARYSRRLLAEMDDRMLADIGISRAEAQTEAARPAWDLARSCR